jgi:8-oxo-dGTP diphosphatase
MWRRVSDPYVGRWALPGVFVNHDESLVQAVERALHTKLGLDEFGSPEQLFTWNKPGRDTRGWVVTVAYFVPVALESVRSAVDARPDVRLLEVDAPHALGARVSLVFGGALVKPAFDHLEIIHELVRRLRNDAWTSGLAFSLLRPTFTLRELQSTFEALLGRDLNKDSFRRTVTKVRRLVHPTGEIEKGVDHRPAELYRRAVPDESV